MTAARAIAASNASRPAGPAWNFSETPTGELVGAAVFGDAQLRARRLLEAILPLDLWPPPTSRKMLFIR